MRAGPYEIQREIGRGGAGVVFRARAPDGSEVAVKVLRSLDPTRLARFEREVRLQSQLGESEGFVPLLGSGETPSGPWLAMPLMAGGTLRDQLVRGPLGVHETRDLGIALAGALARCHEAGIVHRDLKPENVLFTADGRPLIADLGLAKHYDEAARGASQSVALSRSGETLGTVGYMAPEQLEDAKSAGPAADIFSLAAILHECISGTPLFQGDSVFEVADKIDACRVPPIRRLRADAPRGMERALARALARDPSARFGRARDFQAALGEEARPRHTALVAGVMVAAIAAVALVAVPGLARRAKEPAAPVETAAPWIEKGRVLAKKRDFVGALAALDRALAIEPRDVSALVERSVVRWRVGQLDAALADANAAVALDPGVRSLVARSHVHAWRSEPRERARDLEAALRAAPHDPVVLRELAHAMMVLGDLDGARLHADEAIAADPGAAPAWEVRAEVRLQSGDDAKARADVDQALALDPGLAHALSVRARVRLATGDVDGALADLEASLALEPDDIGSLSARGLTYINKGALELARADFEHATRVAPRWSRGFYLLSTALRRLGDREATARALDRALELEPNAAGARLDRAQIHQERREWAAARDDYDRVLAAEPRNTEAHLQRAQCLLHVGRLEESVDDSTVAIEANPSDQRAWFNRAWAHELAGDLDGALADAEKALALGERTWAWAIRGLVRHARGDRAGALSDLERARAFGLDEELGARVDAALERLRGGGSGR